MLKNKKFILNDCLFAFYLFAIWAMYVIAYRFDYNGDTKQLAVLLLCGTVLIFPMAFFLLDSIRKIHVKVEERVYSPKKQMLLSVGFFCFNLFIFLLWFAAYYPGSYSTDSFRQYEQVLSGVYSDWHPFLHTFLFFTIPIKLTGRIESTVVFQLVLFAAVLSYFSMSISRYFGNKMAFLANLYIILNPYTGSIAMRPWKDVGFAILALWIAVCVFNVYFSEGRWLKKTANVYLLTLLLAVCTCVRHNAILYTFFVIVSLWLFCGRKACLRLTLFTLALLVLVKGPIYHGFAVEKPGERHTETMGLPLTIMANVAAKGTEELNQETKDFLFSIASQDLYREKYREGNFNSIKWNPELDTSIVDQTSIADILSMTMECIVKYPMVSAKAFIKLTDMVYTINGEVKGIEDPTIKENNYAVEYQGVESLRELLHAYQWSILNSPLKFLCYIGSTVFLMLAFLLARCSLVRKTDWKTIMLCVPILVYDFGTMLLLTGPDHRFFYVSFLICPIVLLITLKKEEEQNL